MNGAIVFVTRRIPEVGLAALRGNGLDVRIGQPLDDEHVAPDVLIDGVRTANALLCLLTEHIDREVLEVNPFLRGIANLAVGYDNIDLELATELGIPVCNTPGVLTESTADFTFALLLGAARHIPEADRYMRERRYRIWGPTLLLGTDIGRGPDGVRKTLGIVGYGRIGRAVARRARGFDMEVLVYDPATVDDADVSQVALPEVLAKSDFVTLHAALTPATRHLIGEPELRCMKPTALLINAARGPIIDENALVRALREGWIAGAGLDVYENEPRLVDGLAELSNVVLAPHIASATIETRGRMATIAAANAIAHIRGEPAPDCLNPDVYRSPAWRRRVAGPA